MSRVYFHAPSDEAELRGSERAWCGSLVNSIALEQLDTSGLQAREVFGPLIVPDHYLHRTTASGWRTAFETAWSVGGGFGALLAWRGHQLDPFTISLNTVLAVGSDAQKLAARMHGQCEIHAWVDGPNRAWLADIIDRGLAEQVLRAGTQGWEQVAVFLRARDDEPVVTSYSVCDEFPNAHVGGWMPDWPEDVPREWNALSEEQKAARTAREEEWDELDVERQWQIAMDGLRADIESGLELHPGNWGRFNFRNGLTMFDLTAPDRDERLERAFAPTPAPSGPGQADIEAAAETIRRIDEYYANRPQEPEQT